MRPYVERLANVADSAISCYPNAGLPNALGEFDETPAKMAGFVRDFAKQGLGKYCRRLLWEYTRAYQSHWRGHS